MSKIKVLQQNCDASVAEDRSLPYTAYLVCYEVDSQETYDLVTSVKNVDIFDHYWDLYNSGFKWYKQSEGRVSPKLWNNPNAVTKSK